MGKKLQLVCVFVFNKRNDWEEGDKPLATIPENQEKVIKSNVCLWVCVHAQVCHQATHNQNVLLPNLRKLMISNFQEEIQTNLISPHLF